MTGFLVLFVYIAIFAIAFLIVYYIIGGLIKASGYESLKTVTFGDESSVKPNRIASVVSVITLFALWGAFTGSSILPSFLHAPGPFLGDTSFSYTLEDPDGNRDDASVLVRVHSFGETVEDPVSDASDDGFAKNDTFKAVAFRSTLLKIDGNDDVTTSDGARIVAIEGQPVELTSEGKPAAGQRIEVPNGEIRFSSRGTPNFEPRSGLQMESVWLPAPEKVFQRFLSVASEGYQDSSLLEHLYFSLYRVVMGFIAGALVGIPLGYAMGLSGWFRGWFDPIVEFIRPVPPLALISLVIIWAGIGESGKIILLFLAALWIMTIAARAGVSGVNITKVHAAYSLGASKWQILRHVIIPNSLPEIFTGARVAMGVCWGTVVAAELVAAEVGAGMMIMVASRFQLTDIVIMGIILIGVIGYLIDILFRMAENWLVPWKGRS